MQTVGALLAACINLPFLLIYLTIFGMATAYSHPSIRLKGHPIWGLMTVGLGQECWLRGRLGGCAAEFGSA
ncbi:MAG: hypothetical protein R2867_19185 [Caldilineaceae bacterium]